LTLLLLTAAGTVIENFVHLLRVPLGYEPHGVVSVAIPLRESTYASWQSRVEYFESLCNSIRTLSDVVSASSPPMPLLPTSGWRLLFEMLGKPVASPDTQMANVNLVDSDYFRTLETPLLQGRIWNSTEVANGSQLVLVNRTFVRRYSSNENVVGQSLRIHNLQSRPPSTTSSSRSKQTTAVRQIPD
jgi:hypothetical protein